MGILQIMFWIYAFGLKSLLMMPIYIFLIILGVYMGKEAIKNRRSILSGIIIFLVPCLVGLTLYAINDKVGNYYSYLYPIIYIGIFYRLYKSGDDESTTE